MATIVAQRKTNARYVLLGAGYGIDEGASGTRRLMAVCDADGDIAWFHDRDLIVVEVDGKLPAALLADTAYR